MSKVVTFGEIMLRLEPEGYLRFLQTQKYGASFGGAEANVAVSLANFGVETSFVTKLPENDIGTACVNQLRSYGIDVSNILRGGPRMGIYFLEKGAAQRPSKVIYDRADSSISLACKNEFDWEKIFKDATWFHITGITPALSDSCAEICLEACKTAKKMGITISCDLNFRKKLWTKEKANEVLSKICEYVDICISNEEDSAEIFNIKSKNTDINSGKLNGEGYIEVSQKLVNQFGFKKVAFTLRTSKSASENLWSGMLYEEGKAYFGREYDIQIVDRVGSGDSFAAGLIYSLLKGADAQWAIDFAVAAGCLKHSIEGDFNCVSVPEVESLAKGNQSGRVQR